MNMVMRLAVEACPPLQGPALEVGSFCWNPLADLRPLVGVEPYIGTDLSKGPGVDIEHDSEQPFKEFEGKFKTILCLGTLEHVRHPWLLMRNLKAWAAEGAIVIVGSVMVFQVHHSPDYWRFTPEGMRALMQDAGFEDACVFEAGQPLMPHTVIGVSGLNTDQLAKMLAWQADAKEYR